MSVKLYKKIKRIVKYFIRPKTYHNNIEICGQYAAYMARYISDRLHIVCNNGEVACFNSYTIPEIVHLNRAKKKFFYTQENTHVLNSFWQLWENIYLRDKSLTFSIGFDYAEHPKYMRFPYWLEHIFGVSATKETIYAFIREYTNNADSAKRVKDCAFICKKDYFGDRAIMADLVAQVMPMSYPSDFRHNDDDMRGKFGDDKIAYLRQFKFNLCPENSNNRGYVTEKVFEAIKAGCVPIYWGNEGYPEPDILNPNAIVYLDKDKPEEGLALLRKLHEDPKAYAEFAAQSRFLPGAEERIYGYYERLDEKLRTVLGNE